MDDNDIWSFILVGQIQRFKYYVWFEKKLKTKAGFSKYSNPGGGKILIIATDHGHLSCALDHGLRTWPKFELKSLNFEFLKDMLQQGYSTTVPTLNLWSPVELEEQILSKIVFQIMNLCRNLKIIDKFLTFCRLSRNYGISWWSVTKSKNLVSLKTSWQSDWQYRENRYLKF